MLWPIPSVSLPFDLNAYVWNTVLGAGNTETTLVLLPSLEPIWFMKKQTVV